MVQAGETQNSEEALGVCASKPHVRWGRASVTTVRREMKCLFWETLLRKMFKIHEIVAKGLEGKSQARVPLFLPPRREAKQKYEQNLLVEEGKQI